MEPPQYVSDLPQDRARRVLSFLDGKVPRGRRRWEAVDAACRLACELAQEAQGLRYKPRGRGRVPCHLLKDGLEAVTAGGVVRAPAWLLPALCRLSKKWAEGN